MTLDPASNETMEALSTDDPAQGVAVSLAARYREVRARTLGLRGTLSEEDCVVQSMPDASPLKWHLAHTTWFFETFVLSAEVDDYRTFDPAYAVLFNSYYNTVGEQYPRSDRGLLTRPSLGEVTAYRRDVDNWMEKLLAAGVSPDVEAVVELGLHHEQQHQELILTDLKHLLSRNPLRPVYVPGAEASEVEVPPLQWKRYPEALHWIGHEGEEFHFDNEGPRHRVFLDTFSIATRLVTNGEFLEFMADGGYSRPDLWLADGWACVQQRAWEAPLYWERDEAAGSASREGWHQMTLSGLRDLRLCEPLCHVSYYEADAFASWAGARLPSEAEWEVAASSVPVAAADDSGELRLDRRLSGRFADDGRFHPLPVSAQMPSELAQLFGDVWEWTRSPYIAYPGYRAPAGAIGEYNGKFMSNQMVLRGGSCVSSRSHLRASYRNFFYPDARWQFSGLRLARDVEPVERAKLS